MAARTYELVGEAVHLAVDERSVLRQPQRESVTKQLGALATDAEPKGS